MGNSVLVRDDLEIDNTNVIGKIEEGTIVEAVERVINSAHIARYKIKYPLNQDDDIVLESSVKGKSTTTSKMTSRNLEKTYSYGWISEKLRGDEEIVVVHPVQLKTESNAKTEEGGKGKKGKKATREKVTESSKWKDIEGDISLRMVPLNYEDLCEQYTTSWLQEVRNIYEKQDMGGSLLLDSPRQFSRSRKNTMDITADENIDDKVVSTM